MTKLVTLTLASLLALAGLVGFAVPGGLGLHLNLAQNGIHLLSGVTAWYFGSLILPAAKSFCRTFGFVFLLWGIIEIAGKADGHPWVHPPLTPHTIVALLHLVAGLLFLIAGIYKTPEIQLPPNTQHQTPKLQ